MKIKSHNYPGLILIALAGIFLLAACDKSRQELDKKYRYENDGMLFLNGKRTFIIGSYHLSKSENPFQELSEAGFNYVRVRAKKEELDAAHENQLMSWIVTGFIKMDKAEQSKKRIIDLIHKFKTYPSLLCWEMQDEPAFTWNSAELRIKPEPLIQTYQLIKQEDAEHFVYTNHGPVNLVSTLQKYNPSTDIVACDVYPVIPHGIRITYAIYPDGLQGDLLNPYISQVGEYVDKMKRVVNNSKPVFMVLQGFSWEMLRKENDRDPAMIKYPTYEESRFMAYNAIIHGATGIIYWGTAYTPQPSPFWSDLKKVTRELGNMQEVLAAPKINLNLEKEYHELRYSVDTGVEILAKEFNGKTYLITANADKNPVKISLLGLNKFKKANVLKEDRTIGIEDGELIDYYEPFGVHIYELD